MTYLFFDTEFTGLHQHTTLISIGIVDECNDFFYAEFNDYDKNQLDDWLRTNVISNLLFNNKEIEYQKRSESIYMKGNTSFIKEQLEKWITTKGERVEIWSDCLAYDWILFNNIWGHAFSIPKNIYYIPYDLSTALKLKGIDPDINREELAKQYVHLPEAVSKHNALWDAFIIKACIQSLGVL